VEIACKCCGADPNHLCDWCGEHTCWLGDRCTDNPAVQGLAAHIADALLAHDLIAAPAEESTP
jgi:hypothetical protein